MRKTLTCPQCGNQISLYANPVPTVDILIYDPVRGVVLISRKNPPHGYALPGGFVDEGEWIENAALREAKEETGLDVKLTALLGVYSRPDRDFRCHTLTTVFTARAVNPEGLNAGDDAGDAQWFDPLLPPAPMCFDHGRMLADFVEVLKGKRLAGSLSSDWLETDAGKRNTALLS